MSGDRCADCGRLQGWPSGTCPEGACPAPWSLSCFSLTVTRLRAEVEALRGERDEARTAYAAKWDPLPGDSLADLMRSAIEEAEGEHQRFKARGGELDAAQKRIGGLEAALAEVAADDDPIDGCAHAETAKRALALRSAPPGAP